jgi:hypothetical protein
MFSLLISISIGGAIAYVIGATIHSAIERRIESSKQERWRREVHDRAASA